MELKLVQGHCSSTGLGRTTAGFTVGTLKSFALPFAMKSLPNTSGNSRHNFGMRYASPGLCLSRMPHDGKSSRILRRRSDYSVRPQGTRL